MTVALSRVLVALVAVAGVTLVPTAAGVSPAAAWVGAAAVVLAAGLAAVRAPRQSVSPGPRRPCPRAGVPRLDAGRRHAGPVVGTRRLADRHPARRARPRARKGGDLAAGGRRRRLRARADAGVRPLPRPGLPSVPRPANGPGSATVNGLDVGARRWGVGGGRARRGSAGAACIGSPWRASWRSACGP